MSNFKSESDYSLRIIKERLEEKIWNNPESEYIHNWQWELRDIEQEIYRREKEKERKRREKKVDRARSTNTENKGGCSSCFGNLFGIIILVFIASVFFSQENQQTLTSRDGRLKIKHLASYQEACEKRQARSSYSTQRGVQGKLYPSRCNQAVGNVEEYLFLDNFGDHRCQGMAKISTVEGKTFTYWRVDKKVPGYICETVGETYNIEIN
ncbi:hypothetical protein [Okeania sp. SIO2B3]|uniref:hypothetical protein n=1 Tax=Okeania sp. SIO2B3 TaxID=2607784 RepID=UPI0013BFFAB1|nr:hypothetical protein [Okeania sp. SIO2B3]NET40982.1 hypothetical protein [Okeania sp. SIO2B3]